MADRFNQANRAWRSAVLATILAAVAVVTCLAAWPSTARARAAASSIAIVQDRAFGYSCARNPSALLLPAIFGRGMAATMHLSERFPPTTSVMISDNAVLARAKSRSQRDCRSMVIILADSGLFGQVGQTDHLVSEW